ncbi:MAG: histidine kinase [Bacteroidota bacterium]
MQLPFKAAFIFCLLIGAWLPVKAQQPFMWHLTDDDGLPSMEVYSVFEDNKGYMWFGTDNGVCRYDGLEMKNYYSSQQRGKSFSHFIQDAKGRIWCVNFAGQLFYIENDSLKLFEPFEKVYKSGFPRYCFDNKNQLWIISINNPIYYYNFETQILNAFKQVNFPFIVNIVADRKGNVVVAADSIYYINNGKLAHAKFNPCAVEYSIHDDGIYFIKSIQNRVCGIDAFDGKQQYTLNTDAIKTNDARFTDFISFDNHDRWFLTYDGAYIFSADKNKSNLFAHILKGNAISWATKDREGNYWVSTLKNGVFVIPSKNVWLMNSSNSSLQSDRVSTIAEDKNGLLYLASGLGNVITFDTDKKQVLHSIKLENETKDIDALAIDKTTNLLYAHSSQSYIYDIKTKRYLNKYLNFSAVKDYSFDGYGNYFLATSYSAFFVLKDANKRTSPFCKYLTFNKAATNPSNNYKVLTAAKLREQRTTACLVNTADTSLWIAYVDGLYRYHKGKVNLVLDKNKQPINATDIILAPDGKVWISTMQQGIISYYNNKVVDQFTTGNGLLSNFNRCIAANQYAIWFAGEKGVQAYLLQQKKIIHFTKEEGLASNDVLDIHLKNNFIYLATSKGFQWFEQNKITTSASKPGIDIIALSVNNNVVNTKTDVKVAYNENNIDFYYIGIAQRSRGKLRYAYRLMGIDTNWTYVSYKERVAKYNLLPPGSYRFQVKVINKDGVESAIAQSNLITIAAPYWQTWWFVSLAAMALILVVSLLFLYRIKIISNRNKLERERAKLAIDLRASQLSALKIQMNPHFIFNALNSIQEYILTNEKKLANSYLGKFSDLMRLYLDMSNKKSISLDEEIKAMQLYLELEAMRFEEKFNYSLQVAYDLQIEHIMIPPMIIQPYVENAFKHGLLHKRSDRKIEVTFKQGALPNTLVCEVFDNGIGRQQSMELNKIRHRKHASFSTGAVQKRLELLNAERNQQIGVVYEDLYHSDGTPAGTKVTITVPFD